MALEASEVAVRVRLLGGSAFEADASKVAASTDAMGAAGARANKAMAGSGAAIATMGSKLDTVGSKMMSFGRTLSMAGLPLVALGVYASKTASTFQQQMTLLSTNANESAKNIGWMSKAVLDLGVQFGQTPTAIATALYNFESIGIHGKAALNDIRAAAMGSAVGLDSLANTTDVLSSIMKTKIAGSGGPVEAMSLLDRAIGMGKMHLVDLSEALKTGVVPMAKEFHMDLNSVLALTAGLTGLGTPASQVAARARLMFTSMEALSPGGQKALGQVGIGKFQLANDLAKPGHLITALEDLSTHLALLSSPQQNAILAATFGRSRGMGQIAGSLGDLNDLIKTYDVLQGTTPKTLEQHFNQTKATTAFKEHQIRAQFDADMVKLGTTINLRILPVIIRLLGPLQSVVDWFGRAPHAIQDFTLGLAGAVIVGGPLFMFMGALTKGAGMFLGAIESLAGPLGAAKLETALGSTAGAFTTLLPLMAAAAVYFGLFHTKIGHSIQKDVKKLGYNDAIAVADPILHGLSALGLIHGNLTAADVFAYENSSRFSSLSPLLRGDVQSLIAMNSPNALKSPSGMAIMKDLASAPGFNLSEVPGIKASVKEAIKEGMREVPVNVFLSDNRLLAQAVNDANRKTQNRR